MRCRRQVSAKAHPYALLYHLAAHAVVMVRSHVPVISARVDPRCRSGAVHALMQRRHAAEGRMRVERDAVCAFVGAVAEEYGCDGGSWFAALEDCATVSKRLWLLTQDTGELAAWELYLMERARVMVEAHWHEITVIAAVLQRERAMDAASLGATLAAFRANPFRPDLRPLRPVAWSRPTREGGKDEVELLYTKPRLSALVARRTR